jgi:hypothetical protein
MLKASKNFAYSGKTYFVGDEVPANVAAAVDASFVVGTKSPEEKPKAKKTTYTNILEGE